MNLSNTSFGYVKIGSTAVELPISVPVSWHGHHGVSNPSHFECLSNILFRITSKLCITIPLGWEYIGDRWITLANATNKETVTSTSKTADLPIVVAWRYCYETSFVDTSEHERRCYVRFNKTVIYLIVWGANVFKNRLSFPTQRMLEIHKFKLEGSLEYLRCCACHRCFGWYEHRLDNTATHTITRDGDFFRNQYQNLVYDRYIFDECV